MSLSDVTTAMTAAQAALAAGDYDTAEDQALAAQGHLAVLPDSSTPVTTLGFRWTHEGIENFVRNIRQRRNRALAAQHGVQRTKITRARISA